MERIIGIDLGTTNSVVSYFEAGQPVVILNPEGSKTTPSVVFYKSPEEVLVGEVAKRQAAVNPHLTVRSIKRFMGARFSEIGTRAGGINYELMGGPGDSVMVDLGWTTATPEQVSAQILLKLKSNAEEFFGEPVDQAVVTVPAYFNDNQRAATKMAAELAGLRVARIINEPTAAALAFGIEKTGEQRVAVFDFGGGTFDISILELDCDVFEVKSTNGDTFLGGDNIDGLIFADLAEQFLQETSFDLNDDPQTRQRLLEAAERVKCELSTARETLVSLPFVAVSPLGTPLHMNYTFTRDRLESLIQPLIPRLISCCRSALSDARLQPKDINHVLLVGGSTRIPMVQEAVKGVFGREPNRSLNPDESVAVGAGIQASILGGGLREVLLLDVTPLSLGIETDGKVFSVLIPRNSSIPTKATKTFTTTHDNQKAVTVHVLQGERKKSTENHSLGRFRLVDITPAPAGLPEVTVTFQIDANGILQVSAVEATSGSMKSVTIESYAQVSEEQAKELVEQAEQAQADDRLHMKKVFVRHQAQELVEGLTQIMDDTENPVSEELRQRLKEILFKYDLADARDDLEGLEMAVGVLKQASKELNDRIMMQRMRKMQDDGGGLPEE